MNAYGPEDDLDDIPDDLEDIALDEAAGITDDWEDALCDAGDGDSLNDRWDLEDADMDD